MDGFDARRRRRERAAQTDLDQGWRSARDRDRAGLPEGLRRWLADGPVLDDLVELRAWLEELVPWGQRWVLLGLAAAVTASGEAVEVELGWQVEDAVEAAAACARCPCEAHRRVAAGAADTAEPGDEAPEAALIAAAAARLARLAAAHDPLGTPKGLLHQAMLVLRALDAAGVGATALQAAIATGLLEG